MKRFTTSICHLSLSLCVCNGSIHGNVLFLILKYHIFHGFLIIFSATLKLSYYLYNTDANFLLHEYYDYEVLIRRITWLNSIV
jgi:hypothetical protein